MSRVIQTSLILEQSPLQVSGRLVGGRDGVSVDEDREAEPADSPTAKTTGLSEELEELRGLLAAMGEALSDAESARRQMLEELQQLAIELSSAIAGELVFRTIDADAHDVGKMVTAAFEHLGFDATLSISLHPSDLELLETQTAKSGTESSWQIEDVALCPDATLARGHCRATNGSIDLLSEIGPRLEEIRTMLWEGLDDAQIERRQAAGFDSPLKRFPDRRETA